jgi:hypothetical protein
MHSAKQLVIESEAMQESAEQLLSIAAAKEDFALSAQIASDTTNAAAAAEPALLVGDGTVVVLMEGPDSTTPAMSSTGSSSSSSSFMAVAKAASALDNLLTKLAEADYEDYYLDYLEEEPISSRHRVDGVEGVWDAAWDVAISLQHRLWSLAASAASQAMSPLQPAHVSTAMLLEVPYAAVVGPVDSIMAAKREAQLRALAQAVQQVLFVLNREQLDGLLGVDMKQGLSSRVGGGEPELQVLPPLQQYMQVPTGEALQMLLQEQLTAMFFDAMLMVSDARGWASGAMLRGEPDGQS